MRLAPALLALSSLAGCPSDEPAHVSGTPDAPVSSGRPDAPPSGTGMYCVYTQEDFYSCVGRDPWQERSTECFEMLAGDDCPPAPVPGGVVGDCTSSHATFDGTQHAGTSCSQVFQAIEEERCRRAGEGACRREDCTDGQDNDGNGLADCEEPFCLAMDSGAPDYARLCPRPESSAVACISVYDDDGDGRYNCSDPDCAWACENVEGVDDATCGDGIDNDGNGLTDCEEPLCSDPRRALRLPCVIPHEGPGVTCLDGGDNDGDGLIDCLDPDCRELCDTYEGVDSATCRDGIDNDGDGLVDCDQLECQFNPGAWNCARPEICDDGFDNDKNGRTDGEDAACGGEG